MRRGWAIACVCFAVVFGFGLWLSAALPFGDELGPGPGFFPLWLSGLGCVLAVVLLVQVQRQPEEEDQEASLVPATRALLQVLAVVLAVAAAGVALEPVGYRLTALVFTAFLLVVLGARSPIAIVLVSLATSFGVFQVFYYTLKVPLPIGLYGI